MKRMIIEELYIQIVARGVLYDNISSEQANDTVYLDEAYQEGKDYNTELYKAEMQWRKGKEWTSCPEIRKYWKTLEIKEIV